MTLIILFLIAAIIPGYKAFAISMQARAVGSTGDADFWYLIQSSIMAVMGNIIMVVPLLKKSWFSPAYGLMWAFFALGLAFVVISIILYPLVNPGWSFMVAFFGSVASAASVLTMTQATAREDNRGKVKSD
jgi:glucose dehydrogenase